MKWAGCLRFCSLTDHPGRVDLAVIAVPANVSSLWPRRQMRVSRPRS